MAVLIVILILVRYLSHRHARLVSNRKGKGANPNFETVKSVASGNAANHALLRNAPNFYVAS